MAFLERNANRGSISTGYDIDNSLKFESDNSERFLAADPFQSYDSTRTFTRSLWVKRTELTNHEQYIADFSVNTNVTITLQFDATDHLRYFVENSGDKINLKTERLFRDPAAWYHIFLAVDTTQGTASNRVKIYVNGVQETSFLTEVYPTQNLDLPFQTRTYMFGYDGGNNGFCGYATEFHALDGIAAAPTDFGKYDADSGIWIPIEYKGNYGTEGYYLNFSDATYLGKDHGPNAMGNTFADPSAISAVDQATDTPTNNFATWQCNIKARTDSKDTSFKDGGTTAVSDGNGTGWRGSISTMTMASGKWYMEYKLLASNSAIQLGGIPDHKVASDMSNGYYLGQDGGGSFGWYPVSGYLFYWTGQHGQYTTTASANDIISLAIDKDNDKLFYAINGTWMQGTNGVRMDPTTPSTGHEVQAPPYHFAFWINTSSETHLTNMGGYTAMSISSGASDANGYGTFEYAPPTGYYSLCSKNLAEYG